MKALILRSHTGMFLISRRKSGYGYADAPNGAGQALQPPVTYLG
jgi:hypothetical protein